jgi:hypothetical protein
MENVIFLLFFMLPGTITRMSHKRLYPSRDSADRETYEDIVQSFLLSFVAFAAIMLILWLIGINIGSASALISFIEHPFGFFLYFALSCVAALLLIFPYHYFVKNVWRIANLFRRNKAGETPHKTPWNYFFENRDIERVNQIAGIFKDGNMITIGRVFGSSAADKKERQMILEDINFYHESYNYDLQKPPDERAYIVDKEYIDLDQNVTVRFFRRFKPTSPS